MAPSFGCKRKRHARHCSERSERQTKTRDLARVGRQIYTVTLSSFLFPDLPFFLLPCLLVFSIRSYDPVSFLNGAILPVAVFLPCSQYVLLFIHCPSLPAIHRSAPGDGADRSGLAAGATPARVLPSPAHGFRRSKFLASLLLSRFPGHPSSHVPFLELRGMNVILSAAHLAFLF